MPGDEPGFVVASGKLDERGSQLFDGVEGPHPQQVLLQGADESLCYAVALGLAHEGGRCFDPQAFDFVLEIAGHVVGAMIVTQLQSTRHTGSDGSEAPMHALAHRLQGLEAIAAVREVIEEAGAKLRYLPKYSPDLNPIEQAFSKLKAHLRKAAERTIPRLSRRIATLVAAFSRQECTNYFRYAGYASR